MYPDYSKQFVLDYQPNLIGTNALNVAVNEKGLLGSVVSVTTVKLSEVLQEMAKKGVTSSRTQLQAGKRCAGGPISA